MRAGTLSRKLIRVAAILFLSSSLAQAVPPGNGRPFRVVDKNGTQVGYAVSENVVAREINGLWVSFYVHTATGIFDSNAIYVYYTSTDCSGTRYITHYSMFAEGTRVGPRLYYPADQQTLSPRSLRVAYGSGEEGPCFAASDVTGVYGVAATVNIDTFGLELPFKAVQ
jgi:hypothetical protein